MHPPLLVIVSGMAGTGKTSLARQIAVATHLPLIAKDDIKERLFDRLGWSNREWSMKLGRATFDLLFYFIEVELSAGRSLIAEALFYPQYHLEILRAIQQRHPYRPLVIECTANDETIRQRFQQRSESGERHPGHVDHLNYAMLEERLREGRMPPFDLGGFYIEVDTSDFARVDLGRLVAEIRTELG